MRCLLDSQESESRSVDEQLYTPAHSGVTVGGPVETELLSGVVVPQWTVAECTWRPEDTDDYRSVGTTAITGKEDASNEGAARGGAGGGEAKGEAVGGQGQHA